MRGVGTFSNIGMRLVFESGVRGGVSISFELVEQTYGFSVDSVSVMVVCIGRSCRH